MSRFVDTFFPPLAFNPPEFYGQKVKDLGAGTYGTVIMTDKGYAIKKIKGYDQEEYNPSAFHEIVGLRSINSPYILPLIDVILDYPDISLVLPLADNGLNALMANKDLDVIDVIRKICLGLADLHHANLLHLDLKPENILIKREEDDLTVWIADPGISRIHTCAFRGTSKNYFTLWYRPPELLITGGRPTPKSDVWALGVIIAELLLSQASGNREFLLPGRDEQNQLEVIFKLVGKPTKGSLTKLVGWVKDPVVKPKIEEFLFNTKLSTAEIDFIIWILNPDPELRPSIFQVLQHPLIGLHNAPKPLDCIESLDLFAKYPQYREPMPWSLSVNGRISGIEWLIDNSLNFGFNSITTSLAVDFFTRLWIRRIITNSNAEKYLIVCLYLAASFYSPTKVPKPSDMIISSDNVDLTDFKAGVDEVLKLLDFDFGSVNSYFYLSHLFLEVPKLKIPSIYIWRASLLTPSYFSSARSIFNAILDIVTGDGYTNPVATKLMNEIKALPDRFLYQEVIDILEKNKQ